jgi:copper chaperone CopZ
MKILTLAPLALAGVVLAVIALRAPPRDYVPPSEAEVEAHHPAPQRLSSDVPAGCVVRTIDVKGMCCLGCTGRVYDRIKDTPGLVDAAVSFEKGVAQIVIPKDADPGPIVSALRFDKFEPKLEP